MDWNDVDWAALSARERLQVWWDIIIGKTLDEWRDEWAISKAEGFGLKGLSTLLLAATVIVCAAYSILALTTTAGGGVLVRCGAWRASGREASRQRGACADARPCCRRRDQAPAVAALGAKPFALPTSTLLIVVRVVLSSLLVLAEQVGDSHSHLRSRFCRRPGRRRAR